MKEITVLILGVGGNVSMGILTALRMSSIPCRIIGACISPESLGLYYCDAAYISPYAADDSFTPWVVNLCNKENVDIIFTGVEENVIALESHRDYLTTHTKAVFVASDYKHLKIGLNKYETAMWLKEHGCNYPQSANMNNPQEVEALISSVGFPLIAKPNSGKGAVGIFVANSKKDLESIERKDYCLQQILGNEKEEYTVACYMDKRCKQQEILIMHRKIMHGTTFMAEICQDEAIYKECRKICDEFKPRGPLNIQMRKHNGKPICFELNVRFSGTTPIRAKWGYNDVEAMIKEYLFDEKVKLQPQKEGKVYRYYNEAFIDINMQNQLANKGFINDCTQYSNTLNKMKSV